MRKRQHLVSPIVLALVGISGLFAMGIDSAFDNLVLFSEFREIAFITFAGLVLASALLSLRSLRSSLVKFGDERPSAAHDPDGMDSPSEIRREISPDEKSKKDKYLKQFKNLPGENAPRFSVIEEVANKNLLSYPSAYPLTPMYVLDENFRILDWNEAFSLAFDKTIEGRRGRSIVEWTYFLDNFQQVIEHGVETFSDPRNLPLVDVEPIEFDSLQFGKIHADKRAYRIPDDQGNCIGWLILLDLSFVTSEQELRFKRALTQVLRFDQLWSEYTLSYDDILTNTHIYNEMLDKLIGSIPPLDELEDGGRALDVGAGTGNLSARIIERCPRSVIFAVDGNRTMLEILKAKCRNRLTVDPKVSGVIPVCQDIRSLLGLEDDYFDYVFSSNVHYLIDDPTSSFQEIHRVLKPGGEFRLAGPRVGTGLDPIFAAIVSDLKRQGKWAELKDKYDHVEKINQQHLGPLFDRWTTDELVDRLLSDIGFSEAIYASGEQIYDGQSMLISLRK